MRQNNGGQNTAAVKYNAGGEDSREDEYGKELMDSGNGYDSTTDKC